MTATLPAEAERAVETVGHADLVVGIPSFNNARTIGRVTSAVNLGLAKYFPQFRAVVINSDGGSSDGTRQQVLSARTDDAQLLLLDTPLPAAHLLSIPYHGIPGKGSAFRLVFEMAQRLEAKACAVVDSDLRSITPEWIDLLLRPILVAGYDFVAPNYHRHKYDGTITNSIVYPLTRTLYGRRIRQPIGGEFGLSGRLIQRYLELAEWETDIARFGVDIWLTTVAIAEGFRVCQSYLGAKLHDAKDPAADLSSMLEQVVGSVFSLMDGYQDVWQSVTGSKPVETFGFRFDVGLDPVEVNVRRLISAFERGCRELDEILRVVLSADTHREIRLLTALASNGGAGFRLEDGLWTRMVFDFACAHHRRRVSKSVLLRSLTPLYLGRVASFVGETEAMIASEVDDRIERLCLEMEALKPLLVSQWRGEPRGEVNQ